MSSILVCSLKFFAVQRAAQNSLEYRDSTSRSMGQLILERAVLPVQRTHRREAPAAIGWLTTGAQRQQRAAGGSPFLRGWRSLFYSQPKKFSKLFKINQEK